MLTGSAELGSSSCVSLRWLSEKIPIQVFVRVVRTWKYGTLFLYVLVSGSHVFGVWVLHLEYSEFDSTGDVAFARDAMLGSTVDTCSASVWLSDSHVFGVWVLLAGYRKLDSSGDLFSRAMLGSTLDTCSASVREVFCMIFTYFQRWRGLDF